MKTKTTRGTQVTADILHPHCAIATGLRSLTANLLFALSSALISPLMVIQMLRTLNIEAMVAASWLHPSAAEVNSAFAKGGSRGSSDISKPVGRVNLSGCGRE